MIRFSRVVPALVAIALVAPASAPASTTPAALAPGASACSSNAWIDVRCYGATGERVNDDTAAIQNALAAALENDRTPVSVPRHV